LRSKLRLLKLSQDKEVPLE